MSCERQKCFASRSSRVLRFSLRLALQGLGTEGVELMRSDAVVPCATDGEVVFALLLE